MDTKLQSTFELLQKSLRELFDFVEMFPEEKLHEKKSDAVWSVIQVMNHVADVEESSVKYINKKLKYATALKKSGWQAKVRHVILKLSFKLPFKYKAPKNLKEPDNHTSLQDLKNRWDEVRSDMAALLQGLSNQQVSAELFKHPLVGRINMYQAIDFMYDHLERHKAQIKSRLHPS